MGTAVYAFFIVPNTVTNPLPTNTFVNMSFSVDGAPMGKFMHSPGHSTDIAYKQPLFVRTGLDNQEHVLLITASGASQSLILFDYAIYTAEMYY